MNVTTAVEEYLRDRHIRFEAVPHAPTRTAAEEAAEVGVPPSQVAKPVVLDARGRHVVAVIPANRKLDLRRIRRLVCDPNAHLATEDEIARDYPRFELGAFPPLGTVSRTVSYVDPELLQYERVVVASGCCTESIVIDTRDLLREGVLRARLTR